uniref:Amino acid transporter transmembrane domain-containing protein n=1 Tax=Brassica oleracea var. oleracea TaxID=109376 RepID=A0A0D3CNY5_BRAOL
MVWVLSVSQQRPDTISYEPLSMPSVSGSIFSVLSALDIIAFAFRGHNLVLEIQLMYPCGEELKFLTSSLLFVSFTSSSEAFELIGTLCLQEACWLLYRHSTFTTFLLATAFSPTLRLANKPNQQALFNLGQIRFQSLFSVVSRFYIGIALPSLSSLAGLLGGLTLSVTFAYPFFTWVLIKKPANYSFSGYFHWGLGCLGVAFSLALSIGDIWSMVKLKFFSPKVKLMFKVSGFFLL